MKPLSDALRRRGQRVLLLGVGAAVLLYVLAQWRASRAALGRPDAAGAAAPGGGAVLMHLKARRERISWLPCGARRAAAATRASQLPPGTLP